MAMLLELQGENNHHLEMMTNASTGMVKIDISRLARP